MTDDELQAVSADDYDEQVVSAMEPFIKSLKTTIVLMMVTYTLFWLCFFGIMWLAFGN